MWHFSQFQEIFFKRRYRTKIDIDLTKRRALDSSIHSLKGKTIIYLGLACLIMAAIGLYSIKQILTFHNSTKELEQKSAELISEVKKDLSSMELLGKIDTNLKAYLLSPSQKNLEITKNLIDKLKKRISGDFHNDLDRLSKNIDVLAVRMNSLKHNQEVTIKAKNAVMRFLNQAHTTCLNEERCLALVKRLQTYFHEFTKHGFFAISGQVDNYAAEQEEAQVAIDKMIDLLDADKTVVSRHKELFNKIKNACMELSEALETIVLIREKTVASKGTIDNIFASLSETLFPRATASIDQNEKKIKNEFEIAQSTEMLMVAGLATSALILVLFGIFLLTQLLAPVKHLGDILIDLSQLLVNLRNENCNIQDYYKTVQKMPVQRKDEIGQVARALKTLAARIHDLSLFRRTIEADEDTKSIYRRLSRIFREELKLPKFFIMEYSEKNRRLEVVVAEPGELAQKIPVMPSRSQCRAIRTAAPVSSLEMPEICSKFAFGPDMHHICIPMVVAGKSFGMVSFIIEKTSEEMNTVIPLEDRIRQAVNFINEALPILQAKRYALKLQDMALIDQLTGLFNRRYLDNSIENLAAGAVRRKSALGLLMCDMDFFKQVNDEYGHDVGDEVLKQLSNILLDSVRSSDIVVRFGGEEFLIILNDCQEGKETEVAEKIREAVASHTFRFSGGSLKKTVSVGTCRYPFPEAKAIWEAIKFADIALYKAKDAGRNRVTAFEPAMWQENSY